MPSDFESILREADARRKSAAQIANQRRTTDILPALRAAGVTEVRAEYDGQGDSGQIEEFAFFCGGDQAATRTDLDPFKEQIKEIFYTLLEEKYDGWEINEGSYGEFVWNVITDKLHLTHNVRIESTDTFEEEL